MCYSEMSDFEINKQVAILSGHKCYYDNGSYTNDNKHVTVKGNGILGWFQPCSEPYDAWPIIDDIFSTLVSTGKYDDGIGFGEREMTIWQAQMHKNNCGKLRAAMIVFLTMDEGK